MSSYVQAYPVNQGPVKATVIDSSPESYQFQTQPSNCYGFPPLNINEAIRYLTIHEWPTGLQNAFLRNLEKLPIRFFVIDDSGSMATNDGHRAVPSGKSKKFIACTRWIELVESVKFHAGFAEAANAMTEFRFLNACAPMIVGNGVDNGETYRNLLAVLEGSPSGGTPLCRHIREITEKIRGMESYLRSTGQKAGNVNVKLGIDGHF
jgi:hypothetical protein